MIFWDVARCAYEGWIVPKLEYRWLPSAVPGKVGGSGGAEPPSLGPGIVRDIIHVVSTRWISMPFDDKVTNFRPNYTIDTLLQKQVTKCNVPRPKISFRFRSVLHFVPRFRTARISQIISTTAYVHYTCTCTSDKLWLFNYIYFSLACVYACFHTELFVRERKESIMHCF